MRTTRILSIYAAAAVALCLAVSLSTISAEDTCSFPVSKLYVRDITQTAFPAGYLPCVGKDKKPNARCVKCDCRQLQSGKNAGTVVTWGLCIENASTCASPQAPDRKQCGGAGAGTGAGPSTPTDPPPKDKPNPTIGEFEPGRVQTPMESGDKDGGAIQQTALDTSTGIGGSKEKKNTSMMFVVACAIAAVAGIAVFAIVRKKNGRKELGTPKQDGGAGMYKDTDTSKARAKSLSRGEPPRGSANCRGALSIPGADPYAVHHQQNQNQNQNQNQHQQLDQGDFHGSGSDRRDSTSTSDDEMEDDFAAFENDNKVGSFASFAMGDETHSQRFSDIDLDTSRSMGYAIAHAEDEDEYYNKDDARLSIHSSDDDDDDHEEDEEEQVDLRNSTDSVLYSSSASALAYFEGQGSPRNSIEF